MTRVSLTRTENDYSPPFENAGESGLFSRGARVLGVGFPIRRQAIDTVGDNVIFVDEARAGVGGEGRYTRF